MSDLQERLDRGLGDRYRVERELGQGGMAVVYLAEDLRHHRRVAIKVLDPGLTESLAADRFLREIEIAARLNHPRIVPLLDSGTADGLLFYVMPYVEGESLRQRLEREKQLPVEDAVEIACQVAAGLAFAHERGLVHRDVKPGNVLLTTGEAVVADFGVARAVTVAGGETLTRSGVAVGTPTYMSPEQASGERDPDPRADIYGLGCLLHEMLAGEPPFTGATAQVVTARKLTESPPDLTAVRASVPAAVAAAVRRALATVPADRFDTANDFIRALKGTDTPSPDGAAASSPGFESGVSRRGLLLGAAATGLAGFAGGAVLSAAAASREPPTYRRLTFQRGMIRYARFAPDYRTILYGGLWGGDVCRVYRVRPDSPQSFPMALSPAAPMAISSRGEVAIVLGDHLRGVLTPGTLARVPLAGGRPREMIEDVTFADWSPDGSELAVVRRVDGRERLEFPIGNVLVEPSPELGSGFSFPRVSPRGDRVAFVALAAAPLSGRVATVDRQGNVSVLSAGSPNLHGLAWYGDEIWYTVAEGVPLFRNAIHAVGLDGETRVVARIPGNASLYDMSPDGRALIARIVDRGGLYYRGPGDTRERDLSWLDNSDIEGISRDGSMILLTEAGVGGGPHSSVYVREATGEPAVRLADGHAIALSPDGRWALTSAVTPGEPNEHLMVTPVGPGQARPLRRPGFAYEAAGRWLPEGGRVLVRASPTGEDASRFYVQELDGAGFEPVTPAGLDVDNWELSPDGTLLAVASDGEVELYPMDGGGDPGRLPGSEVAGRLLAWVDAGLLVSVVEGPEASPESDDNVILIDRIDPSTGERERWREIRPRDPVGILGMPQEFAATPDGRAYGYSWHRALADLYEVEGLT